MKRMLLFLLPSLLLSLTALAEVSQDGPPPEALAAEPDTGALKAALAPVLASQAGPVDVPAQGVPELGLEELGRLVVQAITGKSWSMLASLLVVGVVLLLRKVGARLLPWLGTERGVALLAVVGGTSTLLALALSQGQDLTLGLLVSCLMGALSASGLWSVGKSLATPRAAAVCTPREIANGTCKPS